MKRRKGNSCFLCEKKNEECDLDFNRPCSKCRIAVSAGGISLSKGTSTLTSNVNNNVGTIPSTPQTPVIVQQAPSPIIQTVTTPMTPTSTTVVEDISHVDKRRETGKPEIPPSTVQQRSFGSLNSNTSASVTPEVPAYQMSINAFLMSELKKVKEDQRRLQDELLTMKLANMKLVSNIETLSNSIQVKGNYYISGIDPSKAMVVFDLTKNPAIVLTTNDTFCQLVGYDMKDVLGAPWHKFIPVEFIDRTMNILSERNLKDSVIQFDQVYKHKDSGIFSTLDTHTIFFANGKPVSDLVFITLPNSVKMSTSGSSGSNAPQPVIHRAPPLQIEDTIIPLTPEIHSIVDQSPSSPPPRTPINSDSLYGPTSPLQTMKSEQGAPGESLAPTRTMTTPTINNTITTNPCSPVNPENLDILWDFDPDFVNSLLETNQ